MVHVCFVCLGNICRSPMAELIFSDMVEKRGLKHSFVVSSGGTSSYEVGNPVYPPAAAELKRNGITGSHIARQICLNDVINNDYIIVMDSNNLLDVLRLTGGRFGEKVFKLLSFVPSPRDVADPWYTGDFKTAFNDVYSGCNAFLEYLLKENAAAFDYDRRH